MTGIIANTVDAAVEKHVPVVHKDGGCVLVHVGSLPHPMTAQHYISMIFLLISKSVYLRRLTPDGTAEAVFSIRPDENVISAYAWCNLHGLWRN